MLLALIFLSSCSENQDNETIFTSKVGVEETKPDYAISVSSKLHRGKKWSERNKVPHCSQSFGFCTVRITSVTIDGIKIPLPKSASQEDEEENNFTFRFTDDPSVLRMSFDTPRKEYQEGIFISSEDDNFVLPDDLTALMGFAHLEIIADNYIFENTSEFPYGVTYLNVNYEE